MKLHEKTIAALLIALAAIYVSGCATTPAPVLRGQEMAIEAITKVEIDVNSFLDAYNTEVKALVAERYAAEFMVTEAKLLGANGDGQSVNLTDYKKYVNEFAVEVAKADAFYDDLLANTKAQIGFKFGVAKNMALAVQAYNKATGLDPETFDQLLAGTSGLATEVLDQYGTARTAAAANKKPDWREVLKLAGKNDVSKLPVFGDPNAAWRKWLETGQQPKLQDLVGGFMSNMRALNEQPSAATDASGVSIPSN